MHYYSIDGVLCCAWQPVAGFEELAAPAAAPRVLLFEADPASCRASFALTRPQLLRAGQESVDWLDMNALPVPYDRLEAPLQKAFEEGGLRAVNLRHPAWRQILTQDKGPAKKRVHLLALGDVGGTLLTGLRLLGGDVIDSIGICDLNEKAAARWEFEANQINYPWEYDALPEIEVIQPEQLFSCDMVVFVASKGIPPVGSQVQDVRMAQFEANRGILTHYAKMARAAGFKGLFCQVSDPVDPLARVMYEESNKNEDGVWDGKGLRPEQIQGFGLGVMNARAAYYAKKDERFASFLTEGRAFGPHGADLVIVNSLEHYDEALSDELTEKAVKANLEMRALGFKPYVAPALSSGALSLLLTLRGRWHYGSVFLGGVFMGCKNRYTPLGIETELLPLPAPVMSRIRKAADELASLQKN